ncbi:MAG: sigma-54-dependent Fis family transcriptional regulator [Burkholderiales bacterium]|nr:sigma-54-dependent Fis family transcriptional regulator [Burkholderiales bacterium]
MTQKYIVVADDEPKMRRLLEMALQKLGHQVAVAGNGREAADLVQAGGVDLVITDLRMPEMDGLALLDHLRRQEFETPVIVITAHGTIETAVQAMKQGAADYLLRPFDLETLELAVERVLRGAEVSRSNRFLQQEVQRGWGDLVGHSAPMVAVYDLIAKVAPTKAPVMICGETGTGKELVARAIHNASPRANRLFVPVNCAAIPAEMLESELFGHEKGAFTGALKERIGKFELANEGTLFLDELSEMPIALQSKLLRVLQDGTLERLGGNRRIALDLRIVAASNLPPREAIARGKLREDLHYRVNVFAIDLPPLRERKDDIPGLVRHFMDQHGGRQLDAVSAEVLARLAAYDWPGNVRELENVVERALILSGGTALTPSLFRLETDALRAVPGSAEAAAAPTALGPLQERVEALESQLITQALAQADGSKPRAAALLQISERTLWYKLKKYRLTS